MYKRKRTFKSNKFLITEKYKDKDVYLDFTWIYNIRQDFRKDGQPYLKFNADCHKNVFNMFFDIPGYRKLIEVCKGKTNPRIYVEMKWIEIDEHYNRCCGLIVDKKIGGLK